MTTRTFRNAAGFGKRIEYWIIGRMLKEGMDVYVPLVDDHAVDAIYRRLDGTIALIKIKARSREVAGWDAALFSSIYHDPREHYWFVFYSERLDLIWLMTSDEFLQEASLQKSGKNVGARSISLNGHRTDKQTGGLIEYCRPKFEKYLTEDFGRMREASSSTSFQLADESAPVGSKAPDVLVPGPD